MTKNLNLVRQAIEGVRTEVEDMANTAERVGGVISDVLEYAEEQRMEIDTKIHDVDNKIGPIERDITNIGTALGVEIARAKQEEEALRAQGYDLALAVDSLNGKIGPIERDVSGIGTALGTEIARAQAAESINATNIVEVSQQVTQARAIADANFQNFSELGLERGSTHSGYTLRLRKKTNSSESIEIEIPLYDIDKPGLMGLVNGEVLREIGAENEGLKAIVIKLQSIIMAMQDKVSQIAITDSDFNVVDGDGNCVMRYSAEGFDVAELSDHFQRLIKEIEDVGLKIGVTEGTAYDGKSGSELSALVELTIKPTVYTLVEELGVYRQDTDNLKVSDAKQEAILQSILSRLAVIPSVLEDGVFFTDEEGYITAKITKEETSGFGGDIEYVRESDIYYEI